MKDKTVLILGAGEMQVPVIKKCREIGVRTIVTDASAAAPGFQFADISCQIDTLDKQKTLELAREYKIDGIVTTSDYPVRTVAFICENLNLKGLSQLSAEICTNKFLQRSYLKASHLFSPKFAKIKDIKDLEEKIKDFQFPLIIKPLDSSASRGVSKILTKDEIDEAFTDAKKFSKTEEIIIEEYIKGNEYSVESLTQNGQTTIIAITEKSTSKHESNYFVEERHIIPANLDEVDVKEIQEYIDEIIALYKIENSATHIELKLTSNGPVLIEIGARLGGDFIASDLVPLSTGVDMLKNVILIALGLPIDTTKNVCYFSGIQFVNSKNYYKTIEFLESKPNGIIRKEIKPFENKKLKNSLDRLGYFIVQSSTLDSLLRILNLQKNNIE